MTGRIELTPFATSLAGSYAIVAVSALHLGGGRQIVNVHSIISVLICAPGWRRGTVKLRYSYLVVMLHRRHNMRILQCAGLARTRVGIGEEPWNSRGSRGVVWSRRPFLLVTWRAGTYPKHNVWRGNRARLKYAAAFATTGANEE